MIINTRGKAIDGNQEFQPAWSAIGASRFFETT